MKLQRSHCKAGLMGTGALKMGISGRRILSISAPLSLWHSQHCFTISSMPPGRVSASLKPLLASSMMPTEY